ncbi:recombinase RecA [Candidatus Uhrbacteria bacterium RIFCSPLOWO2_02_FULL_53_10]|uniref:Protein RecA n=1 Tax=Candidatus Uhrbacteria bacterium RIFCSPLOWO2_02_FULL_53_10 TaxID=1802411 RepID=A0A1F7VIB8_9BACT|nr:MAG: recombinase RecA [Candidatus Uhrbacteria bacterium RIFCSPLOWO2_02_FULL_53_10]
MPKAKKTPTVSANKEGLTNAIDEIQGKYGEGAIMRLGEAQHVKVDAIPTGALSLDLALGVGGLPRGRVVEIFGPESSGKSTLAMHVVAEAQKRGGAAAFIDAEHAFDPTYAKRLGVNTDELLISQPDAGEEALDILETLVKSGAVMVVVVDSVAALTPRVEIEGTMDDQQMGAQARLMSKALRRLTGAISDANTLVIFTNQIRMKIGVMFGNPETTPGGQALKFYSSVRLRTAQSAKIQRGEEIIGNRVKVKIVKNKVAPPFREAEFDIIYNHGIAKITDTIKTAEKSGIIERKGAHYQWGETRLGQGLDQARLYLEENPKAVEAIREQVFAKGALSLDTTESGPAEAAKAENSK